MRVDWLDDLIALLDSGGVADAARLRNITQPAFSRRIKVLEDVLALQIIDRSMKPSGPSAVIRDHEAELRRLATAQRLLLSEMRRDQASGARQLVIASQHAITTSLGPHIINSVAKTSRTHVRLRSANRDECETLLFQRHAEISLTYRITSEPVPPLPSFLTEATLGADTLVPVCGAAFAESLLSDFRTGVLRLIGYPADVFLGAALSRHILPTLETRCAIHIAAETALSTAALHLAQSGLGVTWVPATLAKAALSRGELTDLRSELGALEMDLVAQCWADNTTPTAVEAWSQLTALRF